MRRVFETDAGRAHCGNRQGMIEPVLCERQVQLGSNRFLRRGRAACRFEWRLITATHNFLKLHTAIAAA
jgi:hypothetical protein